MLRQKIYKVKQRRKTHEKQLTLWREEREISDEEGTRKTSEVGKVLFLGLGEISYVMIPCAPHICFILFSVHVLCFTIKRVRKERERSLRVLSHSPSSCSFSSLRLPLEVYIKIFTPGTSVLHLISIKWVFFKCPSLPVI